MNTKYFLKECLGSGAYSKVHRCIDKYYINYACKVLDKRKNDPCSIYNEVQTLKKIKNTNRFVRYIDFYEDKQNAYIITDLYKNTSLIQHHVHYNLNNENNEYYIVKMIHEIVKSLCILADYNIVHRDLKNENILMDNNGIPRIIDFGLSKIYDKMQTCIQVKSIQGSLYYMSPEALHMKITTNTDIWSLGVLIYRLLTNNYPFQDSHDKNNPNIYRVWKEIQEKDINIEKDLDNYTLEAKDFVYQCLQKSYLTRPNAYDLLNHKWFRYYNLTDTF